MEKVLSDRTIRKIALNRSLQYLESISQKESKSDSETENDPISESSSIPFAHTGNSDYESEFMFVDDLAPNNLSDSTENEDNNLLSDNISEASYSEDSSSSSNESDDPNDIFELLKTWYEESRIPLCHMNSLLSILRLFFPALPKDARTLVKTKTHYDVVKIGGGEYFHFGIKKGLISMLEKYESKFSPAKEIVLQFNIDGLPVFKSSNLQFWPILCSAVSDLLSKPFVIGLFSGTTKPAIKEYLESFVNEIQELLTNGLTFNEHIYKVHIHSFICDAPARSFVKCIIGHNGHYGCERCNQYGQWKNKMTFPETEAELRTNVKFDEMENIAHHTDVSPLSKLKLGFISQFPLDYMHLVCLGVVRKLVNLWTKGPLGNNRLSVNFIKKISHNLVSFNSYLPREINRKSRKLDVIDRWKATEFRTFLLYTGPVALLGNLSDESYYNFLMLHVCITILCNTYFISKYLDFAKSLLTSFVKHFSDVYGSENVVYNVHSLIHLADDVQNFGALHNISAFPYENFLKQLKRLVRKPEKALQQIIRRMSEFKDFNIPVFDVPKTDSYKLKKIHKKGPILDVFQNAVQYKQCFLPDFMLSTSDGDNGILCNGHVYVIKNILKQGSNVKFLCTAFKESNPFFDYPLDSRILHIYLLSEPSGSLSCIDINDVQAKLILLPRNSCTVSFPLNHTLE